MAANPEVDTYIAQSQEFARPILAHLRKLVHSACPEAVETIKWGMPHFELNKRRICAMASFKNHCAFIIHDAILIDDAGHLLEINERTAMGHLGRITRLDELPPDSTLIKFIGLAAQNTTGKKPSAAKTNKPAQKKLIVPEELTECLAQNEKAKLTFEKFSYTDKKEYCDWIADAKTETTRQKRLDTTITWLAEGKTRNWKYLKPGK